MSCFFSIDFLSRNSYYKSMKTIVSEKGQITIPKAVRDKLGIVPGTVLEVDSVEGKLVAVKKEPLDAILKWRGKGKVPGNKSVDEYLDRIRG
jgi:antitoxin PrlF